MFEITEHAAEIQLRIDKDNYSVNDEWGANESHLLFNEVKDLDTCLEAEKNGKVVFGIAEDPRDPRTYVQRAYAAGLAAARAAMMYTKSMVKYRGSSRCRLGVNGTNWTLLQSFRAKPACYNDCDNSALNAHNLPESQKSDPIYAIGSFDWSTCGHLGFGSTTPCADGRGYHVCCCRAGLLNEDSNDTARKRGCVQLRRNDTKQGEMRQRALQFRIRKVVDEYNGKDCNYGATSQRMHIASKARNKLELMLYNEAMGHNYSVYDIEQVMEKSIQAEAESFVRLEEAQGSFLDLDGMWTWWQVGLTIALLVGVGVVIFLMMNPWALTLLIEVGTVAITEAGKYATAPNIGKIVGTQMVKGVVTQGVKGGVGLVAAAPALALSPARNGSKQAVSNELTVLKEELTELKASNAKLVAAVGRNTEELTKLKESDAELAAAIRSKDEQQAKETAQGRRWWK